MLLAKCQYVLYNPFINVTNLTKSVKKNKVWKKWGRKCEKHLSLQFYNLWHKENPRHLAKSLPPPSTCPLFLSIRSHPFLHFFPHILSKAVSYHFLAFYGRIVYGFFWDFLSLSLSLLLSLSLKALGCLGFQDVGVKG